MNLTYRAISVLTLSLVEGELVKDGDTHRIKVKGGSSYLIDFDTLSLHCDDMIAGKTDRYFDDGTPDYRIFASIETNECVGGDICTNMSDEVVECIFDPVYGFIDYFEQLDGYTIKGVKYASNEE